MATVLYHCLRLDDTLQGSIVHLGQFRWPTHTCNGMCKDCRESAAPTFFRRAIEVAQEHFVKTLEAELRARRDPAA